jgi:hypothetical protein
VRQSRIKAKVVNGVDKEVHLLMRKLRREVNVTEADSNSEGGGGGDSKQTQRPKWTLGATARRHRRRRAREGKMGPQNATA